TAPVLPEEPTVEEGADEEAVNAALEAYAAALEAYETAMAEFEAAQNAHQALVEQYEADLAVFEAYYAAAEQEAYEAALAQYDIDKAKYDEDMLVYAEKLAAYETYAAQLDAYNKYEEYQTKLAEYNALKDSIPELEAAIIEAAADVAVKNDAVTEAQTKLTEVTEAQATPIAKAVSALESAKALAAENGSEEALAALENAENELTAAAEAVATAEEAVRRLESKNDPTKRNADEVILVDNESLTPVEVNGVVVGYTFSLKAGESIVISDLPADAVYEVAETNNGGADVTYVNDAEGLETSGLVDMAEGSVVAFNNYFEPKKTITVTKTYSGNVYAGEVAIDVYLVTENGDVLVDTVYITGAGSQTIIVDALGEYKAVERPVDNYTASYGENAVMTEDNIKVSLSVTNTYVPPYVPEEPEEDPYEPPVNPPEEPEEPEEELEEPPVPLAPSEDPVEEEEIEEEDIPLIDLPKTGGVTGIGFCLTGLGAIAAGTMLKRKDDEEE
ncbi:MAG: hypothetical protein IKU13_01795, partial [Clostridia bacterium]|nr:hypothetical protein [Clostridia bacterium]